VIPTHRTLLKFARDMGVMLALTAALYVSEHAGDIGLPETVVPLIAAGAMLVYRYVRDVWGKAPA